MSKIPNYVRLATNKFKGSITEKVAPHYLKKEGFVCEKFVLFMNRLGRLKYEQKKTNELRQIFLEMAEDQLKEDKEYWRRYLKAYSSKSPPKDWKDGGGRLRKRTWAEFRNEQIESARAFLNS